MDSDIWGREFSESRQVSGTPNVERIVDESLGRVDGFLQINLREDFQLGSSGDDGDSASIRDEVNLAVGSDRLSKIIARRVESLILKQYIACRGIVSRGESAVFNRINLVRVINRRRNIRQATGASPCEV